MRPWVLRAWAAMTSQDRRLFVDIAGEAVGVAEFRAEARAGFGLALHAFGLAQKTKAPGPRD